MRWRHGIFSAGVGLMSGLGLVSAISQFWLSAGTSLPAQTGLLIAVCLSLFCTAMCPNAWKQAGRFQAASIFLLSCWMLGLPSLFETAQSVLSGSGVDLTVSVARQMAWCSLLATTTLLVPGVLAGCRSRFSGAWLSIGVVAGALLIAPIAGPSGCGLLAAALGLIGFVWGLVDRSIQTQPLDAVLECRGHSPDESGRTHHRVLNSDASDAFPLAHILGHLSVVAIGLLWCVGQRVVRQLVPDSMGLMFLEIALLIMGICVGRTTFTNVRRQAIAFGSLMATTWIWICLAVFALGIRLALWENANVSQVILLTMLRLSFAVVTMLPLAVAGGVVVGRSSTGATVRLLTLMVAMAAGLWMLPLSGVANMTMIAGGVLLACAVVSLDWSRLSNTQLTSRTDRQGLGSKTWCLLSRGAPVFALLFSFSAPSWVAYQPGVAAKLLFDSNVFAASRSDLPWEQLTLLDDCRLATLVEGDRGTLTAWKSHGSQFLVRENGIPKGTLGLNTQWVPRYVPDVLPTLLPMVLHEQPQSVLLLGLRAGEPVAVAAAFPSQRLLAIDADAGTISLCRTMQPSLLTDERLEVRHCEPALAVRSLGETFDVILASSEQPSLPSAASGLTWESLRAMAARLNDEGIFAVRMQHVDLGLQPIRILAKTMSASFRHVAAVQMVPGELLFLGTNSERGFTREGLVGRWQRPHVRQLLASIGWDWSTPLRLPMQNEDAIRTLAEQSGAVVNVASQSTWPFRLPTDVMRWEPKLQKVQAELALHERFLMAWGGDDADSPDVATRLTEWELSRQIIRRHTDEFWAYRKQVKDYMTKSQRSMVQQVSASDTESGLHPDDDRRLRYFRTIGEIAKNPHPTESDLNRLRRFESPFDPLVSQFLHQEVVELTSRCEDRDPRQELHHRLSAIHFSTSADRSVRNVTDAMLFVNSTPDAIADKADRFDHLNALLQTLLARWTARGEFRPTSSRVALNDIERSITAAETTFTTLDQLAAEGTVSTINWDARKQHLERRLVRPLRTYRSQLMQHYIKNERTRDAVEKTATR